MLASDPFSHEKNQCYAITHASVAKTLLQGNSAFLKRYHATEEVCKVSVTN